MKKKSLIGVAITIGCILIASPAILSLLFFYSGVSGQLRDAAAKSATFYLEQVSERTELVMSTLRNSIYYMTSDNDVRKLMLRPAFPSQLEQRRVEDSISQMLQYHSVWSQNSIGGCYIYKDDARCLTMFRNNVYAGAAGRIEKAYEQLRDFNSSRELQVLEDISGYVYCVADYIDIETARPLGKIIFELETSNLVNVDYLSALYPGTEVLMRDAEEKIIFSSVSETRTEQINAGIAGSADGQYLSIGGEDYFYTQKHSTGYSLRIDVLIPRTEILGTLRSLTGFYTGYVLLGLILTLLLGCAVLTALMQPLRRMVSTIDHMSGGDLAIRMERTPYRETEQIVTAFNSMADNLGDLFDEVYDKGRLLKEAEFKLLESQISPHFIFNVLEAINMRCMVAGQPEISRMVTNLAQLLRSNILHKNQQKVTFAQELQYVRYYLELQKTRFAEHLHYNIAYEDDELLQYFLPKLSIQPLVENSIMHGLENKRGGGSVWVRIWEEADAVCVQVVDDGVGFCSETLDIDTPAPPSDKRNHIALHNIHRRIRLLYGEEYGLSVQSTAGQGAKVLLTLPIDRAGT